MASATTTNSLPGLSVESEDPADAWIALVAARRRRRQSILVIAGLVFMVVGYILSPGIVVALDSNNLLPPMMHPVVDTLLLPLEWAHERSQLVQSFYHGYFDLIGVDE